MTGFKSDFLNILKQRSFIHQSSDLEEIDQLAVERKLSAYTGFDCTAPSLHIGNLATLMILYWLQKTGNKPVILMGGATTMIGDPSGKEETRKLLSLRKIKTNSESIETLFKKLFPSGSSLQDPLILNNEAWLTKINYIDMLRDIGSHFSVNRMLTMDSVRLRLERQQEMSFIEFNYMILQAYDFVHLARTWGCNLQIGGSDQWGNIIAGMELGRRMYALRLHALTTPLLTTASGEKMGKSSGGAIWLDPNLCMPYAYWQYWRNVEDTDTPRFLRQFTTLPPDEINRLELLRGTEINEAKKILATEATAFLHGREAAETAAETARLVFETRISSENLPSINVTRQELESGFGLLKALVICKFATSNSEARRFIKGNAVHINDRLIQDEQHRLSSEDADEKGIIKLSLGKKRHFLMKII
ncbi:MAG: tyrosine--tRNA ligase [Alphaproteobacteria bacterium]|nr:tyrosine--tRNA ligase [Alphaproteobacteria bacterium]